MRIVAQKLGYSYKLPNLLGISCVCVIILLMHAFLNGKSISIFPGNNTSNLRNSIFNLQKQHDRYAIFSVLKGFLKHRKIEINTYDIATKGPIFAYIYTDLPYPIPSNIQVWKSIFLNRTKNILLCYEPPIALPINYMKIFHFFFRKVYTWNDDQIDNKKYFKTILHQYSLGIKITPKKFNQKKFLILINSNKLPFYPFQLLSSFGKELYSERIKAIEFFEKNIPDNFYLYGKGWNKPKKYNLTEKFFGFKKYSSYKGEIDNKLELLSNFKYSICFENLTNADGYITEKIFDCFKAKCIPIYWGASNIEKYIPKNCFIDYRDFGDYGKLLEFLQSINEDRYNQYIKNIEALLADKKFIKLWFEEGFSEFFLRDILEFNRIK